MNRRSTFAISAAAVAYAMVGETAEARRLLEELEKNSQPDGYSSFWIAAVLIGEFNVSGDPQQGIVIVAGHYDTLFKHGFVGANDGASSAGILLSFADALAHQKTKMQVWLVWTDLEEAINSFKGGDGLYGSRHLAHELAARGEVSRIRSLFLLDMIGYKDLNVARETNSSPWLQTVIAGAATQLGYSHYFFQYDADIIDDHLSFILIGVPAVDVMLNMVVSVRGLIRWVSFITRMQTQWTKRRSKALR